MMHKTDKPRFTIYYVPTGTGLLKDAEILQGAIAGLGFCCRVEPLVAEFLYPVWQRSLLSFLRKTNFLAIYKKLFKCLGITSNSYAIHLENIVYKKCYRNENHILIPNQEWFEPGGVSLLRFMKAVWCKSYFAENIFRELGCKTHYIGFCSAINQQFFGLPKQRDYFLSRVGKSRFRGAELLMGLWAQHPEWPLLKIVMHADRIPENYPSNVECIVSPEDINVYHHLASSSLFHIYMTEMEGFGHSIVEAMGYGALLLVTNAPPMNEILDSDCALMVDATYAGQKILSPRFSALPAALESAVLEVMQLNEQRLATISANAVQRYQQLREDFPEKLMGAIEAISD